MEEKERNKSRLWLIGIFSSLSLLVWALLGWTGTEMMFHATDGAEFCFNCHVMSPMVNSYREDVHGGKNANGFRATCLQCHLPHEICLLTAGWEIKSIFPARVILSVIMTAWKALICR